MTPETLNFLRALGTGLTPHLMQETKRYFTERFVGLDPATRITRDRHYGPHERHRLDVFSAETRRNAPVLLYVHGGGFVMGDKRAPDAPFYDNVGDFAARNGWVGVTMTYRLAPEHPWPAGSEDVAAAVQWLKDNAAGFGGNPNRIFVMGQSAGAVHVAGYVATPGLHVAPEGGLAGALLISGLFDIARTSVNQFHLAYYGQEPKSWSRCSTLEGLEAARVPLCFTVSEFDDEDFQRQAAMVVARWQAADKGFPPLYRLAGHNHLSPVQAIGTPVDTLGPLIRDFVATAGY